MEDRTWCVSFRTLSPFKHYPSLQAIAGETRHSPAYRHEGKFRQAEQQCLFKYTLRGEGVFRDASGEKRVRAGQGFLCRIRDPEAAYYYPEDGKEPWEFVFITMFGAAAHETTRELVCRYGPIYDVPPDDPFIHLLSSYRRLAGRTIEISIAESGSIANELFACLLRGKEAAARDDAAGVLLTKAERFLQDHLEENLNASDLAQALSCSREHLSRVFRRLLGKSPYQYLVRKKMLHACRLLKETDLASKTIAARLGYSTAAQFTRTFKRVMHMEPSRFRVVGSLPVG